MRTEIFILVYSVQIESTEDAKVYVSPLSGPAAPGLGIVSARTAARESLESRKITLRGAHARVD